MQEKKEKTSRQIQAELTRQALYFAALEVLYEKDFDEITIRDIVSTAGVSVGAFYNYYTKKEDVFYEAFHEIDAYFEKNVAPQLTQSTVYEQIICFFNYYAHYCTALCNRKLLKIIFNANNPYFNRNMNLGLQGILVKLVLDGLERGELVSEIPSVQPAQEDITSVLLISARGLVFHWCNKNYTYDFEGAMERHIRKILKGFCPSLWSNNPGHPVIPNHH